VQTLKIFLGRPDAFPDKSGPTESTHPGRRGLVPEEAGANAEIFLGRPDAFPDKSGPTESTQPGRRGLVPEEVGANAEDLSRQTRRLPGQVRSYRINTPR
jgi:hypothetical protein